MIANRPGPSVRLVSERDEWSRDAEARCRAAGSGVLGRHLPGTVVGPSALVLVDLASAVLGDSSGPTIAVGRPRLRAGAVPVGPDGFLAHLADWPPSPEGLRAFLAAQESRALERGSHERRGLVDAALAKLLEADGGSVEVVDHEGRYLWVNQAFELRTGHTLASVLGGRESEVFTGDPRPASLLAAVESTLLAGASWHGTLHAPFADGTWAPLDTTQAPLFDGERLRGVVTLRRTRTPDRSPCADVEKALQEARREVRAASDSRAAFLANMSHELRTPMNAIIGLAQLAHRQEPSSVTREYLGKLQSSATSLLGLIDDILDMSKIESNELVLEQVEFSVDEVLERVGSSVAQRAEAKALEVLVQTDPEVPSRLVGDPVRLQQVLTSLGNNAVKFTDLGEVRIGVSVHEARDARVVLGFSVSDTGIGIEPEIVPRLFEPFVQADSSLARRFGGTGLGLSIANRLVQLMGGSIAVESRPGQGSVFRFTANLVRPAEPADDPALASFGARRVLVVDDHPSVRDVLALHLVQLGARVTQATDGQEAVELVRASDARDPFALVLMDLSMPRLDGVAAARRIKDDPSLRRRPAVVLVAGHGGTEPQALLERAKADGFLQKPVMRSSLVELLGRTFGEPARRQRRSASSMLGGTAALAGVRVLLVEDNDINQLVASEVLLQSGARVDVADNGAVAVEKLSVPGVRRRYDVVLMDVQMPVMDGYEATRRIRAMPELEDLPIIAMTAHAMAEERARCIEAGMNDHLGKPIDRVLLCSTVAEWARIASVARTGSSERPPSSESSVPDIPGIHVHEALARLGGNAELLRQLLVRFVEKEGRTGEAIANALANGHRDEARKLAHGLKGASANVGAVRLSKLAEEIENGLRAERSSTDLRGVVAQLTSELDALAAAIPTRLEPRAHVDFPSSDVAYERPSPEVVGSVRELIRMMEGCDADAASAFASALPQLRRTLGNDVESVRDALAVFDFDRAVERLHALLVRHGVDLG